MKKSYLLAGLALTVLFVNTVFAQSIEGLKISKVYVPQGFDNNDNATFMLEGYLPSACYRLGVLEQKVVGNKIELKQEAYVFEGPCARIVTRFEQAVFLGVLPKGKYEIVDTTSKEVLGKLPVAEATSKLQPDDFNYANVLDASVEVTNGKVVATLQGNLPNACWKLSDVRVTMEAEEVVTVLPIMERISPDNACAQVIVPFVKKIDLELDTGKYLLHVRSLSGKAITKIMYINIFE